MNKSDLKEGMLLKISKDGKEGLVKIERTSNGKLGLSGNITYFPLECLNDNLEYEGRIVNEIYSLCEYYRYAHELSIKGRKLIWKREKEIDWNKVPIGTKVLVSDTKINWFNGIFLRKIEHSRNDSCFKIVNLSGDVERWKYCKLVEEPKEEVVFDEINEKFENNCAEKIEKCESDCEACVIRCILENYNVTRKENN